MANVTQGAMTEDQGLALVMQVVAENSAAVRLVESLTRNRKKIGLPEGMSVDLALYVISLQRELADAQAAHIASLAEMQQLADRLHELELRNP